MHIVNRLQILQDAPKLNTLIPTLQVYIFGMLYRMDRAVFLHAQDGGRALYTVLTSDYEPALGNNC